MDTAGDRPHCLICQRLIKVDRRQRGRQRLCGREACRRAYQKRWRQQKYAATVAFREAEKKRVRVWRRNHPGYWRTPPGAGPPAEPGAVARLGQLLERLDLTVCGLVSHTTGIVERDELEACLTRCAERGRDLQPVSLSP